MRQSLLEPADRIVQGRCRAGAGGKPHQLAWRRLHEDQGTDADADGHRAADDRIHRLADFLRPGSSQTPAAQPAGPMDLSGGSDAAPAAGGGAPASAAEGEVIQASAPEGTRAPQVGMLPEIDLGRTYTPPPEEGVATQFARSINPTMPGLMAQAGQQQVKAPRPRCPRLRCRSETMNPTERQYAERFLARSGIPGAPAEQLRAFEEIATRGVAAPVPFNPMRAMVASPGGAMIAGSVQAGRGAEPRRPGRGPVPV